MAILRWLATLALTTMAVAPGRAAPVASAAPAAPAAPWQPSPGHTQIALWPAAVPNPRPNPAAETVTTETDPLIAGRPYLEIHDVTRPTITIYSPTAAHNTGAAVLVFPGGGYRALAIDLEGTEVCDWLTRQGITCVVLKYRVPFSGPSHDPACNCRVNPRPLTALQDAQRAMGLLRLHAKDWHIDPKKLGVLGFSAGGHLAAAISTEPARIYPAVDAADQLSSRPDFAVVLYPGHLWTDPKKLELTADITVPASAPPTFLIQAQDDDVDDVRHSLVYYLALQHAGVPVEMHLYAHGGHAFGLRPTAEPITRWPRLVETWLATIGILAR
jgi:acetyl esterase/lipase